jgi:hypothetical protein
MVEHGAPSEARATANQGELAMMENRTLFAIATVLFVIALIGYVLGD